MRTFKITLHGYDTPIMMNIEAGSDEEAAGVMMEWATHKWQPIALPYGTQVLRTEAMTSFEIR